MTEAKPNHSMGPVTTECFNSTSPWAAKRAWQWKSTNWGRTRKKWKLGKPHSWQLRRETASSDGLRSRESSGCSELCERGTAASLRHQDQLLPLAECPEEARDRKPFRKMHWKRNVCRAGKGERETTTFHLSSEPPKRAVFYSGHRLIPSINIAMCNELLGINAITEHNSTEIIPHVVPRELNPKFLWVDNRNWNPTTSKQFQWN